MSATYTAWNGVSYPWPPPDGWYEAVDGRWWADGYGPGLGPQQEQEPEQQQAREQETVLKDAGAAGAVPLAATTADAVGETPSAETLPYADEGEGLRVSRAPLLAAGLLMLLFFAAGLGYLAVREDSTAASLPSTTTTAPPTTTPVTQTTAPPPSVTTTIVSPPTTEPATTVTTTSTSSTTTTVPSTTTTAATTTSTTEPPPTETTAPPPSTVPPISLGPTGTDTEKVAAWRDALAQLGIDSSANPDGEIIAFGNRFCLFAEVSQDAEDLVPFREGAIDSVAGELTEDEMNTTIDVAIVVFCAAQAERLGISV